VRALAILPEACNRTRQHVSLRLDTQLSELEIAVMEHHLARCPACRSFADELKGVTEALRDADLVEPPIHFELPHRPARVGMSRAGTAAAAAILVAVAIGGVAGLGPDAPATGDYLANVQRAQERLSVTEHLSLVADGSSAAPTAMPHGVAAAERTTVGRVLGPSATPASTIGGGRPSTEGW
jgi:putative zinc finger protein